jgi:hypothetical protein
METVALQNVIQASYKSFGWMLLSSVTLVPTDAPGWTKYGVAVGANHVQ